MKADRNKVRKILFITLNNLGDIILTTPVLNRLVEEFPMAKVDVVTGEAGKEIFSAHPSVVKVATHIRKKTLLKRLIEIPAIRKERYDLVCDLKNSMLPYFLGAPYKTGIFSAAGRICLGENNAPLHKVSEHLYKIKGLVAGDPLEKRSFFMPVSCKDKSAAMDMVGAPLSGRKKVIINPGAKSHLKRWPASSYAALADRLAGELGAGIFITGLEEDLVTVREMRSMMREDAVDLCGRTALGVLASVISKADIIVTNDSAPLHVASAVNTPTVAIFGPTDERKYGPLADRSIVLKPDKTCRPCGRALCKTGPDEGCIGEVTVEEVYSAAKRILTA